VSDLGGRRAEQAPQPSASYPAELEADVLLADGRVAKVRPILPSDAVLLKGLHASLSPESVYLRFFSPRRMLRDSEFEHFANVDYVDRLALVALVEGELVAVARYDRPPGTDQAEVAFTVRDDQQGRGIGTILLEHLASAAVATGIRRFVADTLSENHRMLDLFRKSGFEEKAAYQEGVVRVTMELEPGEGYLDGIEERERKAGAASIERLLRPSSIAIVGASRHSGTIGRELLANLIAGDFHGAVYPVNPAGGEIAGVSACTSVSELPETVDLAVIAVPASQVAGVAEACGERGVGSLVVISAGFAETGPDGAAAERELVSLSHRYGMRMVGPNCMGVINTAEAISMNATFAPVKPVRGHIAFASQSGGLGIAILNEATRRDLGVSSFVSVGNKADVSGNDLLCYWENDSETHVILLYLESFGNPRRFSRLARRIARNKPIIAVKSGRSGAGSRGASSHTAAMATPDDTVDALFRQSGVIRVDTLEELFDVADLLEHQPLPKGRGVGIVGNAGGPGVLAADACEGYGLAVPELSPRTQSELRSILSPGAAVANPVDCIASATAEQYRRALEIVLADEAIDAVIAIFTPPLVTGADDVARAVASVAAGASKPIVANFFANSDTLAALRPDIGRVPWFAYPESAARALARTAPYAAWRRRPDVAPPLFGDVDREQARAVVEDVLATSADAWLAAGQASAILRAYGIPHLRSIRATSNGGAVQAAAELGYPVALKVDVPGIVHKTDVGGVHLGLANAESVGTAAETLLARFGPGAAVSVQQMAPAGIETIVGLLEDQSFGPLVMFGLGGTATELLGDRALSLAPLSRPEAIALIGSLRCSKLLMGYRGSPAVDVEALADVLCRVARLAEDIAEITEMDLNPVLAGPDGCRALDWKIRVRTRDVTVPRLRRRQLR
jgi:acetate---CoA ligase (ADP-forming)